MRTLPPGLHAFGDVGPGDRIDLGEVEVTADLIDAFAALAGDRFAIHMSEEAARARGFDGRVAHGLLVLALVDGLKNQAPAQLDAVVSLGWDWSFRRPVLAGDRLRAELTVEEARPSRRPDRGILRLGLRVTKGSSEVVQEGRNLLMVRR